MKPLTASELFDLVKDCPEVWSGMLCFSEMRIQWFSFPLTTDKPLSENIATLTLFALFALAAECGVAESRFGGYYAFAEGLDEHGDEVVVAGNGDHPLAAAVAAYKKGRANGQV